MNIRRLDLNLLVLFDALYRLRSVQAAASEVALSPSAFSHGLARLRAGLEDELFFRVGNEMRPSAFADEIAPAVVFLCSDAARWINGVNLPIDGGLASTYL